MFLLVRKRVKIRKMNKELFEEYVDEEIRDMRAIKTLDGIYRSWILVNIKLGLVQGGEKFYKILKEITQPINYEDMGKNNEKHT